MPSFKFLAPKFFGNTVSETASIAAGGAIQGSLRPLLRQLENETWTQYAVVPPDAYVMAEGVAQGQVTRAVGLKYAKQNGIGADQFDAIVDVASTGPGVAEAFDLWRRGLIDDTGFHDAVKRAGVEERWITLLLKTKRRLLDPADLARGIHKGLIPDPGLLEGTLPTGVGKVPAYPVYPIDALKEAAGHGYDRNELGVLVGLQGNPMGSHEAAQAMFRGVLDENDYLRAVAESNTRNEWADAIREQSRQIPTARDFIENALRGYRSFDEALAGAAKHGMSEEDATVIYQNAGRPMNIHQITMALARGAKFNPEPGEITDPYMASIVEGPVKPGYYELAESLKYSYPTFFQVLNALTKQWIDAKTATDWLLYQGYEPGAVKTIVDNVAAEVGAGKATSVPPEVKSARTALLSALHKSYVKGDSELADVEGAMREVPYPQGLIDAVTFVWTIERNFAAAVRARLDALEASKKP